MRLSVRAADRRRSHPCRLLPRLNFPPPSLQLFSVSPKTKRKTYTFFHSRDGLAAARSSEGGLALLIRK